MASTRLLLILDLNGVCLERLSRKDRVNRVLPTHDLTLNERHIYMRPYLREFIEFVFLHFDVAVWSRSVRRARAAVLRFWFFFCRS